VTIETRKQEAVPSGAAFSFPSGPFAGGTMNPETEGCIMLKDTAIAFAKSNPVIPANEMAFETDSGIFKYGDGIRPYNALPVAGRDIATVVNGMNAMTDDGLITGVKKVTATEYAAIEDAATDGILYLVTADPEE